MNENETTIEQLGGTAFPCNANESLGGYPANGMLLVDYFAGQALVGLLANNERLFMQDSDIVNDAYDIAILMAQQSKRIRGES